MAVKIRLQRFGKKRSAFYRIVAADSRNKRDGRYLEILGTYNPISNPPLVKLDSEAAKKWLEQGAKPTDTVKNIFKDFGLNEKK
jgi:small subunit ribosomal protein S16